VAVECNVDAAGIDQFIDLLVVRKIPGHKETVNQGKVGNASGPVDRSPVNRPCLDDAIRIARGQGQRGTVEIYGHPGNIRIDKGRNTVTEPIQFTGAGVAVIPNLLSTDLQPPIQFRRQFCPPMRDGDEERIP